MLLACALLGACGGDSNDDEPSAPPEVNLKDFPAANGRTLRELLAKLTQGGPVLAPSVADLTVGKNRYGFGLFDRSRKPITGASAVVYIAPVGGGEAIGLLRRAPTSRRRPAGGLPAFADLCRAITNAYQSRRDDVESQAAKSAPRLAAASERLPAETR